MGCGGSASVQGAPHRERESPVGIVVGRFCRPTGAQEPLQHSGLVPVGHETEVTQYSREVRVVHYE